MEEVCKNCKYIVPHVHEYIDNEWKYIASGDSTDWKYPYLKNKYKWFKLITLPNQLFAFFPLLLIIGFIMRSIRNKKIKKQWELEEEIEKLELMDIDEDDEKN